MKKYILFTAILISNVIYSQSIAPKHEEVEDLVKSTYYNDNGKISQVGYYKGGKTHGVWISYDQNGNKKSIGKYNKGEKIGKWFFWNNNKLIEVYYVDNRVISIKNDKKDALVERN